MRKGSKEEMKVIGNVVVGLMCAGLIIATTAVARTNEASTDSRMIPDSTWFKGTITNKQGGTTATITLSIDTLWDDFPVQCELPWIDPDICNSFNVGDLICGAGHIYPSFSVNKLYAHTITGCAN